MSVQVNDPDRVLWITVYAIPALWCAMVAFRPRVFHYLQIQVLLVISICASLFGVVWFWPLSPQFWTKDVWYNVETAREGMGLMIVAGIHITIFFVCAKKVKFGALHKKVNSV